MNQPVIVNLASGADRHMVILGPTTAGKSMIADMFLLSMCLRTSPERMRLVIFDCKNKAHEKWQGLPHMALYAGGGERNQAGILAGMAALERLMMDRQDTVYLSRQWWRSSTMLVSPRSGRPTTRHRWAGCYASVHQPGSGSS